MSCMEPVTEGLIISTDDPEIKEFRAAVIEGLMTNHPHDCPVCDEGGECHLQDMTVMTGHAYRRFNYRKRTYRNQYLGPFIQHEMNRCIQCYRCLRFYKDYAGGTDFGVFGSSNRIYFGRYSEGVLENEFSGNLVEVCPTGVFTDKTLKEHFTRKWDLTNAPSVCVHCSLGCNTILSERYGSARRVLSRYNGAVNGYFICDRGRFGYEFLNSPARIKNVLVRNRGKESFEVVQDSDYLSLVQPMIKGKKLSGIGSPRASLEANFALERLVGTNNFYHGLSDDQYQLVRSAVRILGSSHAHSPSLKEVEKADAVLILGEDLTNSAPMMALAVRQASRNKSIGIAGRMGIPAWNDAPVRELAQKIKSPIFIASPFSTKLDDLAGEKLTAAPVDIARFGFEIAAEIDPSAPHPTDIVKTVNDMARKIADTLIAAENPVIITGLQNNEVSILQAASNIALALSNHGRKPFLSILLPDCNSLGLGLLNGKPLDDLIGSPGKDPETLIILENNLYLRSDREKVEAIFSRFENVIVLDHLLNETTLKADIVLPSGTFAESTGTIVSSEGRAQRYYRVLPDAGAVKDSWKFLSEMVRVTSNDTITGGANFDDIVTSFTEEYPFFIKVKGEIPDSESRFLNEKIARQTQRFSGRTAISANVSVSEERPPQDKDSALAFSMEGFKGTAPSSYLVPYYWSPGWNSAQAMNKYMDEPGGSNKGENPGVLLFNGKTDKITDYFKHIPDQFHRSAGKFLIVPHYLIFGSEELSSESKPVSELIPDPFILLNEKERKTLSINENDIIKLIVDQLTIVVKIRIDNSVPEGIAVLSLITKPAWYISLPAWGKIEKS